MPAQARREGRGEAEPEAGGWRRATPTRNPASTSVCEQGAEATSASWWLAAQARREGVGKQNAGLVAGGAPRRHEARRAQACANRVRKQRARLGGWRRKHGKQGGGEAT